MNAFDPAGGHVTTCALFRAVMPPQTCDCQLQSDRLTPEDQRQALDAARALLTPAGRRPSEGIAGAASWTQARIDWHRRFGDPALADEMQAYEDEIAAL